MQISFFEEFPTEKNLEMLRFVKFSTRLYLASPSVAAFLKVKKSLLQKYKQVNAVIYWPVLEKKEGYWISPFSKGAALKRIFQELKNTTIPVLLDLELPTTQNLWLYGTQLVHFLRNKVLIKNFVENYRGKVYLAEYYPEGKRKEKLLEAFGLHYNSKKAKIIKMVYHSLHDFDKLFITKELNSGKNEFGKNYVVAYGTIARGIGGKEPVLSAAQLDEDLRIAKTSGIQEVVIYRLGGLNSKYLKVLKQYV